LSSTDENSYDLDSTDMVSCLQANIEEKDKQILNALFTVHRNRVRSESRCALIKHVPQLKEPQ
jgi:hypothetical protein